MMNKLLLAIALPFLIFSCNNTAQKSTGETGEKQETKSTDEGEKKGHSTMAENDEQINFPEEVHLKNIVQLTNGGDNAEAYWSFDNKQLVFQSNAEKWGLACDQIFVFDPFNENILDDNKPKMISTGMGRTTCSYFMPDNKSIIYSSTHLGDKNCPAEPAPREDRKYVWPIYEDFDIFVSDLDGKIIKQLTDDPGYDAEPTVSPTGDKIVFTSLRSGDLELYTMNIDGSDVKQVTHELGYDGGAFFSPDGTKLIFRSSRPKTDEEVKEYKDLLKQGLVLPTNMELYVCNIDGSDLKKITDLGQANWAPFFHPSGNKVIFASNHTAKRGFPFNLYMVDLDGNNLEQITFGSAFNAFPMFSPDGKYLVFSSNRNNKGTRDTNLFLAEWVD